LNKPRILRITRPYESVDDYIQSEGWTISTKRMILLDQPRFERDTIVRFELSLQSGEKLIRAEAKVVGYQTATPDKPGGPKVRFKRFGGSTKDFITQVVAEHGPGPGLETLYPMSSRGSDPGDGPISEAPNSLGFGFSAESGLDPNVQSALSATSKPIDVQQFHFDGMPAGPVSVRSAGVRLNQTGAPGPARERLRGLRDRTGGTAITAPMHRDALLARLRDRARRTKASDSTSPSH